MIKLDDNTKQLCKKFLGSDGKFIINETTPSDLVDLFQYFNDNNIDVLTLELDDVVVSEDEEDSTIDEELTFDEDENFENEIDQNSNNSSIVETKLDQNELNDLDNFF